MIIAIANQKGGVGKTTIAYFLTTFSAYDMNSCGHPTYAIDIDPQGDFTRCFTKELPENSNIRMLWDETNRQDSLSVDLRPADVAPNVKLIGSDIRLSYWESSTGPSMYHRLLHWFQGATIPPESNVFIDCPPNLGIFSINAFMVADFVLIPVDASEFSVFGLKAFFNHIRDINRDYRADHPLKVAGICFSNFSSRLNFAKEIQGTITKQYERFVMNTVIPTSIRVPEAVGRGKPIADGPAQLAYEHLYKELMERTT